jgi:hypothetical protein
MRRFLVLAVALASIFTSTTGPMVRSTLAQAAPFDCSTVVTNGGFEDPQVGAPTGDGATGWDGPYFVYHNPPWAHSGNQYAEISLGTTLTQVLNTSGLLAGDTLTIGFWNDNSVTATLGTGSTTTPNTGDNVYQFGSVSYTLVTDAEALTVSFIAAQRRPFVDDVSASCTRTPAIVANDQPFSVAYEGSEDGNLTATGGSGAYTFAAGDAPTRGTVDIDPDGSFTYTAGDGQSGTDSFTFTVTDSANSALTDTGMVTITIAASEPSPTPSPGPESIPDTILAVTSDPRFPIDGSATIDGYADLTYTLATPPSNGTVTVDPDGQYSYHANNIYLAGDTFTVLATAPGGETALVTVHVTYAIDPTVPTYGKVSPGSTGNGGDAEDTRSGSSSPSDPAPTSTPSDGRVQR